MCKAKSEGGKRCDCDNSEQRRLRRKVAIALENSENLTRFFSIHESSSKFANISEIKDAIVSIQEEFNNGKKENETVDQFYSRMEQKTTYIGSAILGKVHSTTKLSKEDKKKSNEHYGEYVETNEMIEKKKEEVFSLIDQTSQQINEFAQKFNNSEYENIISYSFGKKPYKRFFFDGLKTSEIKRNVHDSLNKDDLTVDEVKFLNGLDNLAEQLKDAEEDYRICAKRANELYDQADEYLQKYNAIHAKAYGETLRNVLSEIREMGGNPVVAGSSDTNLVEILNNDISRNYPKEWIDLHNNYDRELAINTSDGKLSNVDGYYMHDSVNDSIKNDYLSPSPVHTAWSAYNDNEMNIAQKMLKDWNVSYSQESVHVDFGKRSKTFIFYETNDVLEDEPKENNSDWELKPHPYMVRKFFSDNSSSLSKFSESENIERAKKFVEDHPVWVRKDKTLSNVQSQIIVGDGLKSEDAKKSNLLHEFGHRMEAVIPDNKLVKLEKSFLNRRANERTDFKHNFFIKNSDIRTSYYSSRVYPNGQSFEVFTTGMESVFYGKHNDMDKDHQSFVIGALATV